MRSADLGADHVRLYKALGGGWQSGAGDATPVARRRHASARSASMNAPIPPSPTPGEPPGAARTETDLATLLDEPAPRAWWRRPALWIGVALLALLAAGALGTGRRSRPPAPRRVT